MIREEAYHKMLEGYFISHSNFAKDEYLYMDDSFIIRDENGNEFETNWDLRSEDTSWNNGWFIYKNKVNKVSKEFNDELNKKLRLIQSGKLPETYALEQRNFVEQEKLLLEVQEQDMIEMNIIDVTEKREGFFSRIKRALRIIFKGDK